MLGPRFCRYREKLMTSLTLWVFFFEFFFFFNCFLSWYSKSMGRRQNVLVLFFVNIESNLKKLIVLLIVILNFRSRVLLCNLQLLIYISIKSKFSKRFFHNEYHVTLCQTYVFVSKIQISFLHSRLHQLRFSALRRSVMSRKCKNVSFFGTTC